MNVGTNYSKINFSNSTANTKKSTLSTKDKSALKKILSRI